jgi:beta-lactamase class A
MQIKPSMHRRTMLAAIGIAPLVTACAARSGTGLGAYASRPTGPGGEPDELFRKLEADLGGRLGVFAQDTGTGRRIAYRAEERFPLCSTFKFVVAAAVMKQAQERRENDGNDPMQRRIRYTQGDLVTYSPVTEKHLVQGMTLDELCAATIQYSDNTAGNLLLREIGGPEGLTAFARSTGDQHFRLDRWETALNSAIPGDLRDTSTPEAMAMTMLRLVLGNVLAPPQRKQLKSWLLGNTTGAERIKAGIPADWQIGDKTGAGAYGTNNDVAMLWPPGRPPIALAVYSTQPDKAAKARNDVVAAAAKIVADALS